MLKPLPPSTAFIIACVLSAATRSIPYRMVSWKATMQPV